MKLYVFPVAPNPTKVRLYLAEKRAGRAAFDVEEVMVDMRTGEQRKEAHLTRNPFGKLPVLKVDSGKYLLESLAIIVGTDPWYRDPKDIRLRRDSAATAVVLARI